MREALLLVGLVALSCGPVKHATVRSDFAAVDERSLLRVIVITAPLPAGDEELGEMWSLMAKRYVNHHRDFLVLEGRAAASPDGVCVDGLDGVLHLAPTVRPRAGGAEVSVIGRLLRCRDGVEVWRAEAGGSWGSVDETVQTVIDEYVGLMGEGVRAYVAPTFHLLRATLDTLPAPKIEREEDVLEKIELAD